MNETFNQPRFGELLSFSRRTFNSKTQSYIERMAPVKIFGPFHQLVVVVKFLSEAAPVSALQFFELCVVSASKPVVEL